MSSNRIKFYSLASRALCQFKVCTTNTTTISCCCMLQLFTVFFSCPSSSYSSTHRSLVFVFVIRLNSSKLAHSIRIDLFTRSAEQLNISFLFIGLVYFTACTCSFICLHGRQQQQHLSPLGRHSLSASASGTSSDSSASSTLLCKHRIRKIPN